MPEKGATAIQFTLGRVSEKEKKYDTAVVWYKKAAKLGHTQACYNLGFLYQHIYGNCEEALKWFRKAAELGCSGADVNIKMLLRKKKREAKNE